MQLQLASGRYYGETVQRFSARGLLVVESRLDARARLPVHSHENDYICAVFGGSFNEKVGARTRECKRATVKFHPAAEEHSEHFGGAGARLLRIEMLHDHATLGIPNLRDRLRFDEVTCGAVFPLIERIYLETLEPDDVSLLLVEALTAEIIAAALRTPERNHAAPRWLASAREQVESELGGRLSLADIARQCGVHPVHLAATFRRHMGCTVGEYRRRVQVQHAATLLRTSALPLADIAVVSGFSDQSHLSRVFRRQLGLTPGKYRAAHSS